MKSECVRMLSELTGKSHIFFAKRGNAAILACLTHAKSIGKKKAVIQDQGGWLTYRQFPKKLGLEMIDVKTDYGLLDSRMLSSLDSSCCLLLNSCPGYITDNPDMEGISSVCKKKGILLINDVSGSIGGPAAFQGDIMLGSFGKWKPLEVGTGGFIASDSLLLSDFDFPSGFYAQLYGELKGLHERRKRLFRINENIKGELSKFEIIHREMPGFNVIVKYNNEAEKQNIVDYCASHNYEHTQCPRYIRVDDYAISIEVKRLR